MTEIRPKLPRFNDHGVLCTPNGYHDDTCRYVKFVIICYLIVSIGRLVKSMYKLQILKTF